MSKLQPYRFEPERSQMDGVISLEDDDSDREEEPTGPTAREERVGITAGCSYDKCDSLATAVECL